ncbi:DUF4856 domain-containing protein [Algibacillus agarilyticus]|uniref:DUF4856 domain-containing protein n=1 Tax=Algibacillus agarilyticus TaxID=2234133 RepID=UPI000DCF8393|nr:DUF4856 domain-containing protein [Algibacillus agarilyticus]
MLFIKNQKNILSLAVAAALTANLVACGGGSDSPTVENTAPSNIELSATAVKENMAGVDVATITVTDSDANDTFSITVDNADFTVSGTTLKLATNAALSFADDAVEQINLTVTDKAGATFTKAFDITVLVEAPTTYTFESQLTTGSSVSYSGQVARHALIQELTNFIGSMNVDDYLTKQAAVDALNVYFIDTDDAASDKPLTISTTPGVLQATVREISDGKNIVGKIAGNDTAGQYKDWSTDLIGWGAKGSVTPQGLVEEFIGLIADQIVNKNGVNDRVDPAGNPITSHYVTTSGLDLKQLTQKFLLGSVAYSQGIDDYLDSDLAGKGLLSDNVQDGTKPYTKLEHQVDEGFGYFGAARDYASYTDSDLAGKSTGDNARSFYHDTDTDGSIDLNSEYNFGNSTNAGKRDLGATVATDFSQDAFDAFLTLRTMANNLAKNAGEPASDEQIAAMQAESLKASNAWELAIASTVVHYINDVVNDDLPLIKAGAYSATDFANLAKHWSELKGFALGLQFNRFSPLSEADFTQFHSLVGDAPVIESANVDAYIADLKTARGLLATAYAFDSQNVENW